MLTERAGTVMFAPQARLVDLSSGRVVGTVQRPTATQPLVAIDLVSAVVTLVNTNLCQFEVTLNNQRWGARDQMSPVVPPWKYNDFSATRSADRPDALTLGQIVRLDMRYGESTWIKMILGRITDLAFGFTASGATLKVTAEDMLNTLKVRRRQHEPYRVRDEAALLQAVLHEAGDALAYQEQEHRPPPPFDDRLPAQSQAPEQTYLDFIISVADRLDCELYIDFLDRNAAATPGATPRAQPAPSPVTAPSVASEVVVRMEPYRGGIAPGTLDEDWTGPLVAREHHLELRWGRNLVSFTPTIKVWDLPTSVTASGSRPPPRRGRNDGIADIAELTALCRRELHDSPAYPDLRPKDAVTARTEFLTAAGTPRPNEITYSLAGLDAARCERQARAVGMKALRGFMTATAKVLGVPKLRPGMHVHVVGLRPPFDGFYYVVKTVHTLDASGYVTDLTLERPGMLPPSAYMPATPPAQGTTTGGSP